MGQKSKFLVILLNLALPSMSMCGSRSTLDGVKVLIAAVDSESVAVRLERF